MSGPQAAMSDKGDSPRDGKRRRSRRPLCTKELPNDATVLMRAHRVTPTEISLLEQVLSGMPTEAFAYSGLELGVTEDRLFLKENEYTTKILSRFLEPHLPHQSK